MHAKVIPDIVDKRLQTDPEKNIADEFAPGVQWLHYPVQETATAIGEPAYSGLHFRIAVSGIQAGKLFRVAIFAWFLYPEEHRVIGQNEIDMIKILILLAQDPEDRKRRRIQLLLIALGKMLDKVLPVQGKTLDPGAVLIIEIPGHGSDKFGDQIFFALNDQLLAAIALFDKEKEIGGGNGQNDRDNGNDGF
jgi:hypothetical protein